MQASAKNGLEEEYHQNASFAIDRGQAFAYGILDQVDKAVHIKFLHNASAAGINGLNAYIEE